MYYLVQQHGQTLPPIDPNARLLVPPPPIQKNEENWPQLTVTRGVFESQVGTGGAKGGGGITAVVAEDAEEGGWGDEDLMLDEEGGEAFLEGEDAVIGGGDEEGGWEVDEDLELPPDLEVPSSVGAEDGDEGFFVPPTRGIPPGQHWANNSRLVADHVLAGSFESAFRFA